MGIQLLFVVETNEQSKSDYIYIKSVLDTVYNCRILNDVKLSPVYMRGKGNYKQNRITKQIESLQNKYKKVGNTKVIYCIDTDQFDKKTDDKRILNEIEFFCKKNGYDFVWFCHDVEEVFLGHSVPSCDKTKCANIYASRNGISRINKDYLKSEIRVKQKSNLINVLDKHLNQYISK